jgi:hypothetical protein
MREQQLGLQPIKLFSRQDHLTNRETNKPKQRQRYQARHADDRPPSPGGSGDG